MRSKTLLVPTDYSEASDRALQYATSLASCMDAKLLIVHVSELELMGSVAESVIRQADCPVLTIRQPAMEAYPLTE